MMESYHNIMKNVIKFILSFMCYAVFVPLVLALTLIATWYLLPAFQTTYLGKLIIGNNFTSNEILIIFISISLATIFFWLMGKLFVVIKSSKALNFYTHLVSWLLAIVLAAEAGYAFVASDTLHSISVDLDLVRKIGILACAVAVLLYAVIAPKVRKLVDRRIQAYDTAKELNAEGRSSIVGMQILKCFDFICPEIFLLIALCFAFNWSISLYFIFIICAFILPILGNMVCDHRVKVESKRKKIEAAEAQANATAEAVADLLGQRSNTF